MIPTIRCVMPSHEQPELKRDKEITRTIAAHTRRCFGVYGTVARSGRRAEGVELELAPPNRTALSATAGSGAAAMKRAVMRAVSAAMPSGKRS